MKSGIYSIRNKTDGTIYIGSSAHLVRRLNDHRYLLRRGIHSNIHLQRAWARDGEASFEFTVTAYVAGDQCLIAEQKCLDAFRAIGAKLYNIATCAEASRTGSKWSDEFRARIMPKRAGQWDDPERKARMIEKSKAVRADGSLNAMQSEKMKAYWAGPKGQAIRANPRKRSAESRIKVSQSLKGLIKSPETCAKLSASLTGRKFSPEHIANIKIAQQKRRAAARQLHTPELALAI